MKTKKIQVMLILAISFLMILIFNFVTPMLSDDLSYGMQVRNASSFADLVRQEANQYMTWNGRSVAHLLLRCFLALPMPVFKVCNSIVFILLSVLIYLNIYRQKKWSPFVMLLSQLGLWFCAVDFSQTVLWETGACNYLWTTTLILGFMTIERHQVHCGGYKGMRGVAMAAFMLLYGIVAGWCSENTSGACLVFLFILLLNVILRGIGAGKSFGKSLRKAPAALYAGIVGNAAGLFIMVSAPGNKIRASYRTELHSGIVGMVSRFVKLSDYVKEYFLVLLIILAGTMIASVLLEKVRESRADEKAALRGRIPKAEQMSPRQWIYSMRYRVTYFFLFLLTVYALLATTTPQPRAVFGAGIFLLIACIQGIESVLNGEIRLGRYPLLRILCYTVCAGGCIVWFFDVMDGGTNLLRIWRDENERIAYIEQQKAAGEDEITVAQLHQDFKTRFSAAYLMDLTDDPDYWINVGYEQYYGVSSITAIPYDDWAVMTGKETEEEAAASKAVYEKEAEEE